MHPNLPRHYVVGQGLALGVRRPERQHVADAEAGCGEGGHRRLGGLRGALVAAVQVGAELGALSVGVAERLAERVTGALELFDDRAADESNAGVGVATASRDGFDVGALSPVSYSEASE
jgi:hypothetical protein